MKNKRGNVAVIALIIVIVAITASVITWLVATKSQAPVQQAAVTEPAPVVKTQPIAQQTPVDETANWQTYTNAKLGVSFKYPEKLGDSFLDDFAQSILDKKCDGLGCWTISRKISQGLLNSPACDTLNNNSDREVIGNALIPNLFSKPNICNVLKKEGGAIFYALGKNAGGEGLPSFDAGLLIVEKNKVIVVEHLLSEKINKDLKTWIDEYKRNNPKSDWGDEGFMKLYELTESKINQILQNHSVEMNDSIMILEQIARSIK